MEEVYLNQPARYKNKKQAWKSDVKLNGLHNIKKAMKSMLWREVYPSADAMFNSALIYELAVLKQFAEPLLYSIEPDEPEYFEAVRLLKFLSYFLGVNTEELPKNSIVREFVGGSCFKV